MISLGRPLLADPDLPVKLAAGQAREIRPCIMCLHCQDCLVLDGPVGCSVNPAAGAEREYDIIPAQVARKVAVVGGGPAGMEAARVCALRGHDVTLYEREDTLGGLLALASRAPSKQRIASLRDCLVAQLDESDVKVQVSTLVTASVLRDTNPDVVVVATGSIPVFPAISGTERANVIMFDEVLRGRAPLGDRIVVVGGGSAGCETADLLAKQSRKVTIVEMLDVPMSEAMPSRSRDLLLEELAKHEVEVLAQTRAEAVTEDGIEVTAADGARRLLPADSVVLAAGFRPHTELYETVVGLFPEVHTVGDCSRCGLVMDAIQQAYRVAVGI
jgi:NADPH-dependent 2,4-dienoyl-CoA reductase/sulfur reductase-like enzyme